MELISRRNVDSPVGAWGVEGDDDGVTRVYLPHDKARATGRAPEPVADAARQLEEYFAGTRRDFDVKLARRRDTDFQRDVWRALTCDPLRRGAHVRRGRRAGGPPARQRAVGNANHANPWPIIVPCHRVVAANGLGGYGGRRTRSSATCSASKASLTEVRRLSPC